MKGIFGPVLVAIVTIVGILSQSGTPFLHFEDNSTTIIQNYNSFASQTGAVNRSQELSHTPKDQDGNTADTNN